MARQFAFRHRWLDAIMAESSGLKTGEKVIAGALWRHMDSDGGSCYPTIHTLAKECGVSVRSAIRHLQALDDNEWLARGHRRNADGTVWKSGKGWRRYQYSGHIPDGADTISPPPPANDPISPLGADTDSKVGADTDSHKPFHSLTEGLTEEGLEQTNEEWLAGYERAGDRQ